MPDPKRQSSKPPLARKSRPPRKSEPAARKSEPKKSTSSRASKTRQQTGGVLRTTARRWSWNKISPERKLDILGVLLALVGLLTLLSLLSSQNGAFTGWWVQFINQIAGWGAIVLPVALIIMGVWLVLRNVERLPMLSAERLTGVILLYLNVLAWMHLLGGGGWLLAKMGEGGGYIGAAFEQLTVNALGVNGAFVTFAAWTLIAIALTLDVSVSELFHFIQMALASLARRVNEKLSSPQTAAQAAAGRAHRSQSLRQAPVSGSGLSAGSGLASGSEGSGEPAPPARQGYMPSPAAQAADLQPAGAAVEDAAGAEHESRPSLRKTAVKGASAGGSSSAAGSSAAGAAAAKTSPAPVVRSGPAPTPWKLPDISEILEPAEVETVKSSQDRERAALIEETLQSFGAPVKVVDIQRGPTVTQFGVEPLYIETTRGRTRVRVSKIAALADDLALALAAARIRIQAPVPGRGYVGIEVPNQEVSRVALRDVLESDAFRKIKSPVRFALGKDVSGHPKAYDLAAMPHLLIAGTTGSGKSVCVNAILVSLLLNNTPADLRMILVDPKRVELTGYNGIPHLLAPVIVEAEQVVGALQWVQREMDARYHRFSQVGARNIKDYNARNDPPLPYMLVLIDELADLMMLAPDETERSLTRLAQLARATGIHLVLATQRPSVDVLTGLIKANFPARVAFAVASGTDSRVILDQPGAERLLGRGDMLFQAPDAAAPVRLQGVFVSDPEIQRTVEFWRQQAYELRDANLHTPTAAPVNMDLPLNAPLKQAPLWDDGSGDKPGDPIMPEAIKIVREEGKASISMLQRKLRIGYTRAARLIDQLEERGIIGPVQPTSQVREVLDYGDDDPDGGEDEQD
ncbi:MAG: DNA translocase FtsK [Chloroflexi bacterium]|nr:DNA translocase FtsK [Chloroflexota bacterium]